MRIAATEDRVENRKNKTAFVCEYSVKFFNRRKNGIKVHKNHIGKNDIEGAVLKRQPFLKVLSSKQKIFMGVIFSRDLNQIFGAINADHLSAAFTHFIRKIALTAAGIQNPLVFYVAQQIKNRLIKEVFPENISLADDKLVIVLGKIIPFFDIVVGQGLVTETFSGFLSAGVICAYKEIIIKPGVA